MSNNQQSIGAQPAGLTGVFAGKIMNLIHSRLYKKIIRTYILDKLDLSFGNTVLDIGCGGGRAVRLLFEMLDNSMICGIDHSEDMVALSSEVNKKGINRGIVEIKLAEVSDIPYPDDYFNIITAFDSINFWDDLQHSLSEISRVLSENGVFLLVNASPAENSKWYDFVKFKTGREYVELLERSGFKNIKVDIIKNTIIIYGWGTVAVNGADYL